MDEDQDEGTHTPMVVGGVYTKHYFDNQSLTGMMVGSIVHPSGRREGRIITEFQQVEYVMYGSPELDKWTLVAEPMNLEILADRDKRISDLTMEVERLKLGSEPMSAEQALLDTKKRSRLAAASGSN